jgi:hypothetical protein
MYALSLKRRVSIERHRELKRRTYLGTRCSTFRRWYFPRMNLRDYSGARETGSTLMRTSITVTD